MNAFDFPGRRFVSAACGRRVPASQIRGTPGAASIARLIFYVYSAAVRWWIAKPEPDPVQGIRELRSLLALQFEGLATRSDPASSAARIPTVRRRKTA